jgi:hypothetical protein
MNWWVVVDNGLVMDWLIGSILTFDWWIDQGLVLDWKIGSGWVDCNELTDYQ